MIFVQNSKQYQPFAQHFLNGEHMPGLETPSIGDGILMSPGQTDEQSLLAGNVFAA